MPGPWIKLDHAFWKNPKVMGAGNAAVGAYVRALAYCGDNLTDGYVPQGVARVLATSSERAKVTAAGLWQEVAAGEWLADGFPAPGDGYFIPDYTEHNLSRADVLARYEERSEAGRKGAQKRWQQP